MPDELLAHFVEFPNAQLRAAVAARRNLLPERLRARLVALGVESEASLRAAPDEGAVQFVREIYRPVLRRPRPGRAVAALVLIAGVSGTGVAVAAGAIKIPSGSSAGPPPPPVTASTAAPVTVPPAETSTTVEETTTTVEETTTTVVVETTTTVPETTTTTAPATTVPVTVPPATLPASTSPPPVTSRPTATQTTAAPVATPAPTAAPVATPAPTAAPVATPAPTQAPVVKRHTFPPSTLSCDPAVDTSMTVFASGEGNVIVFVNGSQAGSGQGYASASVAPGSYQVSASSDGGTQIGRECAG